MEEEDRVAEACIGYRRDIGPAITRTWREEGFEAENVQIFCLYDQANAVYRYYEVFRQMLEKLKCIKAYMQRIEVRHTVIGQWCLARPTSGQPRVFI